MTRSEQEMYRNIERIAVALETLVIQGKDQKIDTFKKTANLIYGNEPTGRSEDTLHSEGRSSDNYEYLSTKRTNLSKYGPIDMDTRTQLQERMFQESQKLTGGEFQNWYNQLTGDERQAYTDVYGH
tara:strand:+ start:112 stop:489 length:378 start_codon:yes stop_codon:yes gene_type:complete